jgi:hypothetical protein
VSLANDFVGYLPTDAILAEGAYEAGLSPCRPIESALTAHAERALAKARRKQFATGSARIFPARLPRSRACASKASNSPDNTAG